MCGIAGAFRADGGRALQRPAIEAMGARIAHRGPDAHGVWESDSGDVALIHRRLSVIDLSTGGQPMQDASGRFTLVFNGEIYNYKSLRGALEAEGHSFRTTSDTEVLLRHLSTRGPGGIRDLRGMFAFALWDASDRRLLLARDPVGKKPLYFRHAQGSFSFASTLGALEEILPARPEVDRSAVDSFLRLGYIPAPATIFEGIHKLPASAMLVVDADGARMEPYWSFQEDLSPFTGTYADALDHLDGLLREAVSLRLQSDVPLGVFLSGGIDSSLITALASEASDEEVNTFSIAFDESAFDESAHAKAVAQALGTRHRTFQGQLDLLELLPTMVRHFGEPFGDATALPTWRLAEHSRQFVTVALSGDGGDEGFGGYEWYFTADRLRRLARWIPRPLVGPMADIGERLSTRGVGGLARAGRGLRALALPDAERFGMLRSFLGPAEAGVLLSGALLESHSERAQAVDLASLYRSVRGSPFRRMRCVDIDTYLADCLLPKVDVATMAHGLEARAPLLDQEVLAFALRLPDKWMADGGGGKLLLRDLLARYLPRELFERPKQGFTVPLKPWFAGELSDRVGQLAESERLMDRGWFRPEGIRAMAAEHVSGHRDHSQRIFNLLVLDEWLSRT